MPDKCQPQNFERNESIESVDSLTKMASNLRLRLSLTPADGSDQKNAEGQTLATKTLDNDEEVFQPALTFIEIKEDAQSALEIKSENELQQVEIANRIISSIESWAEFDGKPKKLDLSKEENARLLEIVKFWQDVSSTDFIPTMEECLNTLWFIYKLKDKEEIKKIEYLNGDIHPMAFSAISYSLPSLLNVITAELVEGLSKYFIKAAKKAEKPDDNPFTVVEVGAGSGKLAHCLQQYCDKKSPRTIRVIATDNGADGYEEIFDVERLCHTEAIKHYKPDIILSSWMPPGIDFSKAWRMTPYVKEYILIGDWDGCTGSEDTYAGWHGDWNEELDNFDPKERDGFIHSSLNIPALSTSIGYDTSVDSFQRD